MVLVLLQGWLAVIIILLVRCPPMRVPGIRTSFPLRNLTCPAAALPHSPKDLGGWLAVRLSHPSYRGPPQSLLVM